MAIIQSLFLSFFQGVFEFLPVSSSGHLFFFRKYLGFSSFDFFYDLLLHFGTLMSVCVFCYRFCGEYWKSHLFLKNVFIGWIVTVIVALALSSYREHLLDLHSLAIMFFLNGCVLLCGNRSLRKDFNEDLNWKKAVCIGFAQGISIFPGLSRSALTICIALLLKVQARKAFIYSFVLSVPTVFCAFFYQLIKDKNLLSSDNLTINAIGFLVSMCVGFIILRVFFRCFNIKFLNVCACYSFCVSLFLLFYQLIFY